MDTKRNFLLKMAVVMTFLLMSIVAMFVLFTTSNKSANATATTYSLNDSYLTKNVQSSKIVSFDQNFQFKFDKYRYNDASASDIVESKLPAIASQTIPIKVVDGAITSPTGGNYDYTTVDASSAKAYIGQISLDKFMTSLVFPNAGVYSYKVSEVSDTSARKTSDGWTESKSYYIMRIYVINDGSGLSISGVTFEQYMDDFGNNVDVGKKDPQKSEGNSNGIIPCTITDAGVDPLMFIKALHLWTAIFPLIY